MATLQNMKEQIIEIVLITKTCLTTIWFWIPPLYAAYLYVQLWMIFAVHPLTIFILPIVLAITMIFWKEKRLRIQYGLDKVKSLEVSHPLGAGPRLENIRWDAKKAVREYEESLGKRERKKRKR